MLHETGTALRIWFDGSDCEGVILVPARSLSSTADIYGPDYATPVVHALISIESPP